jgi:hypothetical protein
MRKLIWLFVDLVIKKAGNITLKTQPRITQIFTNYFKELIWLCVDLVIKKSGILFRNFATNYEILTN